MEEHQASFDALKHDLTTPVLSYPDLSNEFVLETDTSLKVWGLPCNRCMMMAKVMSLHMLAGPYALLRGPCKATALLNYSS